MHLFDCERYCICYIYVPLKCPFITNLLDGRALLVDLDLESARALGLGLPLLHEDLRVGDGNKIDADLNLNLNPNPNPIPNPNPNSKLNVVSDLLAHPPTHTHTCRWLRHPCSFVLTSWDCRLSSEISCWSLSCLVGV